MLLLTPPIQLVYEILHIHVNSGPQVVFLKSDIHNFSNRLLIWMVIRYVDILDMNLDILIN